MGRRCIHNSEAAVDTRLEEDTVGQEVPERQAEMAVVARMPVDLAENTEEIAVGRPGTAAHFVDLGR